jgi:hypothetical protein
MALSTKCRRGHELTDKTLYIAPNGMRVCKPCRALTRNRYRATEKGKLAERRKSFVDIKRHPEKQVARSAVYVALRNGTLTKPKLCQLNLDKCWGRIEAHHDNYSEPLNVTWLCMGHHREKHYA